jgi:hypothetical protein
VKVVASVKKSRAPVIPDEYVGVTLVVMIAILIFAVGLVVGLK